MNLTGLPLAFGAGILAAFNPCGVAVLPSYIVFLLGEGKGQDGLRGPLIILRGLMAGAGMTTGFVSVFVLVGLLISALGQTVAAYAPWLAVIAGAAFTAYGLLFLLTGSTYLQGKKLGSFLQQVSPDPGKRRGFPAFYIYGVGYSVVSLGCTLPIFLVAVFTSFTLGGFMAGVGSFILYALGMGIAVTALSVFSLLAGNRVSRWVGKLNAHFDTVIAVFLLLTGLYLLYYWLLGPGALI